MLEFERAEDQKPSIPSWLFIGGPGSGKTTLLGQAAKFLREERGGEFLIVNMEAKERAAVKSVRESGATIVHLPTWDEIMQIVTAHYKRFSAGIAIDGIHNYARECMYDITGMSLKDRFRVGAEWQPQIKHWYIFAERLRNHFEKLITLDIPIVCTCLPRFDKDELSGEIFKSLAIGGQTSVNIPPVFAIVGICEYVSGQSEMWEVRFRPERGFPARDTQGILAPREKADFAYLWKKYMSQLPQVKATPAGVKK